MDARVDGINFDAVSNGGEALWEIKTHNLANYNAFTQMMMFAGLRLELTAEQNAAHACGYGFAFGAGDPGMIQGLISSYDWAVQAPPGTCIQPPNQ